MIKSMIMKKITKQIEIDIIKICFWSFNFHWIL